MHTGRWLCETHPSVCGGNGSDGSIRHLWKNAIRKIRVSGNHAEDHALCLSRKKRCLVKNNREKLQARYQLHVSSRRQKGTWSCRNRTFSYEALCQMRTSLYGTDDQVSDGTWASNDERGIYWWHENRISGKSIHLCMEKISNQTSVEISSENSTSGWRYHPKTRTQTTMAKAGQEETCEENLKEAASKGWWRKSGICLRTWSHKDAAAKRYWGSRGCFGKAERIWKETAYLCKPWKLCKDGSGCDLYAHERWPYAQWATKAGLQHSACGELRIYRSGRNFSKSNRCHDIEAIPKPNGRRSFLSLWTDRLRCWIWKRRKSVFPACERNRGLHQACKLWTTRDKEICKRNRPQRKYAVWQRKRLLPLP